jgi:predicted nucleotidyltransferase
MPDVDTLLRAVVAEQPHPLLFATISGAHLYGFPSPDSDYDLRGVHVLPLREVIGLTPRRETLEVSAEREGLELDLVTHDVEKFCRLLLRPNGYVLEQLCSPLVVHTTPAHAELLALVSRLVTRHHAHHYLGFAETQWRLFDKERPRRVKPLLYVFRVLLTGTHLMRTGEVEANLVTLNETYGLPYVPELVARKLAGPEQGTLDDGDVALFAAEYARLRGELEAAREASRLPDEPDCRDAVNDLLVRVRLGEG